jgi:hypothetical protein
MMTVTNNEGIVRRVIAVALALALQAAGLNAPLLHAHPDDHETPHHAGRSVHSHWAGHSHAAHHSSNDPAFSAPDEDDRALFFNTFVAVAVSHLAVPAVAPAAFRLHVPTERAALGGVEVVRSHDPPSARSLPPRAPPALLS